MMKVLKTVILVLLLVLATWRVVVLGIAEYYVDSARKGDPSAAEKALTWDPGHPEAAVLLAEQIRETEPDRAEVLLRFAIDANPAKAEPMVKLAAILADKGEVELADKLVGMAEKLEPASTQLRLLAANYWVKRQHWDRAIEDWRAALITKPTLGKTIYPVMLQMAENDRARPLLKSLIEDPPVWWPQFFQYLARHAVQLESVVSIANMRRAASRPFTGEERRYLVNRLMRDGEWPGAYLTWVNGLNETQLQHLGSVYNGDFELEPSNEGFGWHLPKDRKNFEVRWRKPRKRGAGKALRVIFRNKQVPFRHLYQPLFLVPGHYQFSISTMVDRLRGRGGVRWVIVCAGNPDEVVAESGILIGLSDWQNIGFKFEVPDQEDCRGQILRLESTGKTSYHHTLEGDIWFDEASIRSSPE